jgi:DNA-binding LacI/PurR family transcriptional regulator
MSTATVSRALRGLPVVSEATRDRVQEAARRLGYVPSPHAVRLAGGRTRTVAIVVPYVTRWFFSTVVGGAEEVLRAHDHDLLLYNLGGDEAARERALGSHLLTKRVDAILLLGLFPRPHEVTWLGEHATTVTTLGAEVDGWSSVRIDDHRVARTAVEHLIGLGHETIGLIGGFIDVGLDLVTPSDRNEAYRRALLDHGLPSRPELEADGDFTLEGGYRAGLDLLDRPVRPTAVFCASDEMAVGLLRACRERGVRVPEDLSVVGVDDHEVSPYLGLTTVAQPVREQGRAAATQVLGLLATPVAERGSPERLVLPTELVVRGTTAARL